MIKKEVLINVGLCILITLIHIIVYSEFNMIAKKQDEIISADYIRFIISDKMPFNMANNNILRFLRSNLILEIIQLYIIMPVLRTEPDYKMTELIYHGSRCKYIWHYLKKVILRTAFILIWNILSVILCRSVFRMSFSFTDKFCIFLYILMIGFLMIIISSIIIVFSINIKRYQLIGIDIVVIFLMLTADLKIKNISIIYYDDLSKMSGSFAIYLIICCVLSIVIGLKGRKV